MTSPEPPGEQQGEPAMTGETAPEGVTRNRYRKKPVVIEAQQFIHDPLGIDNGPRLAGWCGGQYRDRQFLGPPGRPVIEINTLEGMMEALPGDWIIKGVKGEFYPCKDDIFAATYEPASSAPGTVSVSRNQLVQALRHASETCSLSMEGPHDAEDCADAVLAALSAAAGMGE